MWLRISAGGADEPHPARRVHQRLEHRGERADRGGIRRLDLADHDRPRQRRGVVHLQRDPVAGGAPPAAGRPQLVVHRVEHRARHDLVGPVLPAPQRHGHAVPGDAVAEVARAVQPVDEPDVPRIGAGDVALLADHPVLRERPADRRDHRRLRRGVGGRGDVDAGVLERDVDARAVGSGQHGPAGAGGGDRDGQRRVDERAAQGVLTVPRARASVSNGRRSAPGE